MRGWIKGAVQEAMKDYLKGDKYGGEVVVLNGKVTELKNQISKLEIDKDRKEEEYARKEREIEHKIGLERKRQEFEIDQAKKTTEVSVREENLKADKERFKEEMEFQRKHLEGEIGSLRVLVVEMLKRLPSAKIYTEIKHGKQL
jgi:hypothetical protein